MRTERLFGLDFVADGTIRAISEAVLRHAAAPDDRWHCLVTPNVDHLVRYERRASERAVAAAATLVIPDGMPIVWASRVLGRPLRRRLTGTDVFADLWPRLVEQSIPAVVVAASEEVRKGLAEAGEKTVTIVAPHFDVSDDHAITALVDQIDADVRRISAGVVVIGISMPKHHLLAGRLHERWTGNGDDCPYVLLLGAAPEFYLGLRARAPRVLQRLGLEWLHRLVGEPGRLSKRYLVDDVRFVGMVWRAWRGRSRPDAAPR